MSKPIDQERELFEAHYVAEFNRQRSGNRFTAETMKGMRTCDTYGDRPYLNGQWLGWQARAAVQPAGVAVPEGCRQRLAAEGKPYPRSSCSVCGQLSPKWRECNALLAAAADKYLIGELTFEKVFKPSGLTNLSDLQAVFDSVEAALSAQQGERPMEYACCYCGATARQLKPYSQSVYCQTCGKSCAASAAAARSQQGEQP